MKFLSGRRQNYRQLSFFHGSIRNFGGLYLQLQKGQICFTFGGMGQCSVTDVTYRTHVALCCGCSIPAAEWLDSSAVGIA